MVGEIIWSTRVGGGQVVQLKDKVSILNMSEIFRSAYLINTLNFDLRKKRKITHKGESTCLKIRDFLPQNWPKFGQYILSSITTS